MIHHKITTHFPNTKYEAGTFLPVALVNKAITLTQAKRKEKSSASISQQK